ncbi:hypothetical protein [Oceanithermus sp.]
MENATLYARPLQAGANFSGPLLVGEALNPDIPEPVRGELEHLRRELGAGHEDAAWAGVIERLAPPGEVLGGYRVFVRTQEPAIPRFIGFTGPPEEPWWHEYGLSLPEDLPVPEPAWPALAQLKRELERASAHFFRQHLAAYQGEEGVYVRTLLDLGDRPLEILLYEDGYLVIEAPIHTSLPHLLRVHDYVLEELAYRHVNFNLRVDGRSILVARIAGRVSVAVLGEMLGPIIEDMSLAATELNAFIGGLPKRKRPLPKSPREERPALPKPPRGKTLCLAVYQGKRGRVFVGPLVDGEGVFNLELPRPVLRYVLSAWDYHCAHYKKNKLVFAMDYLMHRMPGALNLAYAGFAFEFWWSDGSCEEEPRD